MNNKMNDKKVGIEKVERNKGTTAGVFLTNYYNFHCVSIDVFSMMM